MSTMQIYDDMNGRNWVFGRGQSNFISGQQEVMQNINTRLYCFLGDCFFDLAAGIDWFTFLGSKNQIGLGLAIKSVILNTPNVTGILQLSMNLNDANRSFSANYIVQTAYSQTGISGVFYFNNTQIGG